MEIVEKEAVERALARTSLRFSVEQESEINAGGLSDEMTNFWLCKRLFDD